MKTNSSKDPCMKTSGAFLRTMKEDVPPNHCAAFRLYTTKDLSTARPDEIATQVRRGFLDQFDRIIIW